MARGVVKDRFEVVVVGSGAGGGVVAGELAQRGKDALLLEAGPHLTAVDFDRWEAKANHTFWWPIRFGSLPDGDVVTFLAGRCVGGTTTINTKVALRAHEKDVAKWHAESGLTADGSRPFALSDLEPYYADLEPLLSDAERAAWIRSTLEQRRELVLGWWNERDPLPLTELNERWVEQQRRIRTARETFRWRKPIEKEKLVGLGAPNIGLPAIAVRLELRTNHRSVSQWLCTAVCWG